MEILGKLGIDWRLLLAQLVNFTLLLFVLHRFLYRPLLSALQKRTETIEKSIKDAQAIEKNLKETEQLQSEILAKAKREAQSLIQEAEKRAEQKRQTLLEKTKEDVANVVADAKRQIAAEKDGMLEHAREEFNDMVIAAVRTVLEKGLDKTVPKEMIHTVVKKAGSLLNK